MFNVLSVCRVSRADAQLQGDTVSYGHPVGPRRDVQVVLLAPVKGDVRPNCYLLFGLLLWSQVSLCGLSLRKRDKIKFVTVSSRDPTVT